MQTSSSFGLSYHSMITGSMNLAGVCTKTIDKSYGLGTSGVADHQWQHGLILGTSTPSSGIVLA